MRRIVKQSLVLGLSLMLSVSGSFGEWRGNSALGGLTDVKAMVMENEQKSDVVGIDILNYESNTSAEKFVVNDIAGFEKIAELVNSGKEDFSGKTITLNVDLKYDKTVENNHKIIGDYLHPFNGAFDGGFHIISGINVNPNLQFVGLFGKTGEEAKLSKIILDNSRIMSQGESSATSPNNYMGGIVGYNVSGSISECVSGKNNEIVGGNKVNVGGIVGGNDYAHITRCVNFSTVVGENMVGGIVSTSRFDGNQIRGCVNYGMINTKSDSPVGVVGGICGDEGNVVECCNMGKILSENEREGSLAGYSGGIVGQNSEKVINSYNAGQVIVIADKHVGGIVGSGNVEKKGWQMIQNSYSVGKIENGFPGAIVSVFRTSVWELSNCYWLTGTAPAGVCETGRSDWINNPPQDTSLVFEYNKSKMQSQAFVDELNVNSKALGYGEVWTADTEHINNGYPILKNVPYKISDLTGNPADDEDNTDLDEPLDTTPAPHFYEDHDYTTQATNSTIQIYANGGTVAVPGTTEKKNYKRCILYTDILPSYIYTAGKNGAIKPSSGKVVVGITASNQKPALVKGKIVDKSTSKIASASIKSGQITVTAKSQPGKVYLWTIDTGRAGASACIPVTVKGAPTTAYIYSIPDTDPSFAYGATKQFKSGQVGIGESIKVYLYPAYKQNGVVQKAKNVKYTASVAVKAADYFSVAQSGSNPYCFEISAKGLKGGKSVAGAITFTCNLNGKKAVFKATAINPVTNISTVNENGLTKSADNSFNIKASDTAKISGTFELQPVCASNTDATTDKLKIYAMGSANGYDTAKLEAGKVQITAKKTSAQGKVSLKPAKDKKTVTVTVAKGAKPVTAYFLVVYNTINNGSKKGYTVISVTIE